MSILLPPEPSAEATETATKSAKATASPTSSATETTEASTVPTTTETAESTTTVEAPTASRTTIEAAEATAPASRTPRGGSGALITPLPLLLLGVERLRLSGVLYAVPIAVVVFLPSAARILVHIAVAVSIVVVAHPCSAGGLTAGSGHLRPSGRLLLARVRVAVGCRAASCGNISPRIIRGAPLPVGVVAGVDVLYSSALSGRHTSGHGVVRRSHSARPGIAGPCVVTCRAAANRRGRSPVRINVASGRRPTSGPPRCGASIRTANKTAIGHRPPVRRSGIAPAAA